MILHIVNPMEKFYDYRMQYDTRHEDPITVKNFVKGMQVRGMRKGSYRPHVVYCEYTIENEMDRQWEKFDLLPMGSPLYTVFIRDGLTYSMAEYSELQKNEYIAKFGRDVDY